MVGAISAAVFLYIIIGFGVYFIPSIIGFSRGHKSKWGIFILNLFLGWSILGWIVSLVWSFSSAKESAVIINNHNNQVDGKTEQSTTA